MSWTASDIPDQSGRVAAITGANSGLGFEATRALAQRGATVVMAVRNHEKGLAAAERIRQGFAAGIDAGGVAARDFGADLDVRELDLGSLVSIRTFANDLLAAYERVEILLNNAAIMATPPGETADGFETQVGTNHLGHFALTAALMPALQQAEAARVVTVTSIARFQGHPLTERSIRLSDDYRAWRAYGDSKLANYHFGVELARRLEAAGSSVASLVAHPGYANTNLQAASVERGGAGTLGRLYDVMGPYVGMSPREGVLSELRAATDPAARNGEFYGPRWILRGAPVKGRVTERSAPRTDTEHLWQVSESAIGTEFAI